MTPNQIKTLRHTLGENTKAFGARFLRSGRTVEEWEQGRRAPDPLAAQAMAALERKHAGKPQKTASKKLQKSEKIPR